MKTGLVLGLIVLPIIMAALSGSSVMRKLFDLLALIAFYFAGALTGIAVYENYTHATMFSTDIHHIFLNFWFLLAFAYLGIYIPYCLIRSLLRKE